MTAELITHGGEQFGCVAFPLTAHKAHEQGKSDYRRGHVEVNGIGYGPAALAAVCYLSFDEAQVLVFS